MTGLEAACAAARRYAQLIYYHDRRPNCIYSSKPSLAWHDFRKQFILGGISVNHYTVICFAFSIEMKRLVEAERERRVKWQRVSDV